MEEGAQARDFPTGETKVEQAAVADLEPDLSSPASRQMGIETRRP